MYFNKLKDMSRTLNYELVTAKKQRVIDAYKI